MFAFFLTKYSSISAKRLKIATADRATEKQTFIKVELDIEFEA
jgi:hypothetical protein